MTARLLVPATRDLEAFSQEIAKYPSNVPFRTEI